MVNDTRPRCPRDKCSRPIVRDGDTECLFHTWRRENRKPYRSCAVEGCDWTGPKHQRCLTHGSVSTPASRRNSELKRKYGMTAADFDAMAARQGGLCAICGSPPSEGRKNLALDHDHATGRVRGLLCGPCNRGIGHFRDDPELMHLAIEYLSRDQLDHGLFALCSLNLGTSRLDQAR
jgi:hypothetical protein